MQHITTLSPKLRNVASRQIVRLMRKSYNVSLSILNSYATWLRV